METVRMEIQRRENLTSDQLFLRRKMAREPDFRSAAREPDFRSAARMDECTQGCVFEVLVPSATGTTAVFDQTTSTMLFTPSVLLQPSTLFRCAVQHPVSHMADHVFSFTTGAAPAIRLLVRLDDNASDSGGGASAWSAMEVSLGAEPLADLRRALCQRLDLADADIERLSQEVGPVCVTLQDDGDVAQLRAEDKVAVHRKGAAAPPPPPPPPPVPAQWEVPSRDITDVKMLGKGTFGHVWEVQCRGKRMAFKCIHVGGGGVAVAAAVAALLREARSMQSARHPNVVALLGVTVDDPLRTGLLIEVADRGTLRDFFDAAMAAGGAAGGTRKGSGLPVVVQLKLAREVTAGMAWLHSNTPRPIVHRDLKTSNVLVMADGTCKISDFGMAAGSGMTTATGTARGGGTRVYAAPEMLAHIFADDDSSGDDSSDESGGGGGGGGADGAGGGAAAQQAAAFEPASDIYALGLVFYAITTGKEPWEKVVKQNPEAAALKVARKVYEKQERPPLKPADGAQPFLEDQLRACWAQDPAARPTAAELLCRFEQRQRDDPHPDDPAHEMTGLGDSNFDREHSALEPGYPHHIDELLRALREVRRLACRTSCVRSLI
jgi:serine/threonine protein kinase